TSAIIAEIPTSSKTHDAEFARLYKAYEQRFFNKDDPAKQEPTSLLYFSKEACKCVEHEKFREISKKMPDLWQKDSKARMQLVNEIFEGINEIMGQNARDAAWRVEVLMLLFLHGFSQSTTEWTKCIEEGGLSFMADKLIEDEEEIAGKRLGFEEIEKGQQ